MIKKLSLVSLFTLLPASFYFAQTTVFAYVKDSQGKPVENAQVDMSQSTYDVTADKIGYFQFVDLKPGHYKIEITKLPFDTKVVEFDVKAGEERKDLGVIRLGINTTDVDQGFVMINDSDFEQQHSSSTVGLLSASKDVYSRIAGYNLGPYWFRPRGIDSRTEHYMLNGVAMNRPDTGHVDFSTWGGLNDIVRYPDVAINHSPSEFAFGGVGNVLDKNMKASEYREGSQLIYSLTNRNYRHRLSYRFTSGMNDKGWAFTGMLARRWAQEGRREGTFYDAISGYLGVEKKFSDSHTLALNIYGSNYRRSTSSPNTQEVYDYRGVEYNAYWGWQDGRKRSERVKKGFTPVIQLTDYWKINDKSQLWTTLSYQFGKEKSSRLTWFNANNPSPIYYKNLPSYWENYEDPNAEQVENYNRRVDWWTNNDQAHTQIDWESLYRKNLNAPLTENGRQAYYFLVNDVKDNRIWNLSTHYINYLSDNTKLFINVSYRNYYSEQYRAIKDLLGADYALNLDPFAKTNQGGSFNTEDTNLIVREGDKYGYDYIYRHQDIKFNPGIKFAAGSFDAMVTGLLAYATNSREGLFKHYLYENSYGKSESQNFWNYGVKGRLTYTINGRNFLVYNGAYYTKAPYLDNIFVNSRNSNSVVPNVDNTIVNANDLSYIIASPKVKLRATGYLINTQNETDVQHFFGDGVNLSTLDESGNEVQGDNQAMLTQVLSNVNKRFLGAELGVQVKITPAWEVSGLVNIGQYTYANNPTLYFATDDIGLFYEKNAQGQLVASEYKNFGEAYLKDYKVGGTPQQAYSLGLSYRSPNYWWVSANWNYLSHSYLDPSPAVRTNNFIQNVTTGAPFDGLTEAELRRVLQQKELPDAHFVNLVGGKSWRFGKYYFSIFIAINNVLNNKNYITGGFEQTRYLTYDNYVKDYDRAHPNFAPKYWYNNGRSYFINFKFSF